MLFAHHGAGYSALSYATFVREFSSSGIDIGIIAFDCRAHGLSSGAVSELSIDCLVEDFYQLAEHIRLSWTVAHPIFLAGHSLGGAVATKVLARGLLPDVLGLIVIDVVEEAALKALVELPQLLQELCSQEPFTSLEEAIRWSLQRKTCRNVESASISVPAQLSETDGGCFKWRVDLRQCQDHWRGWFTDLTENFISCFTSKILVLAEREYLDRPLMIASMQGKFQTAIIRDTGHAIQEDRPSELAEIIISFIRRNIHIVHLNQNRPRPHR